MPQSLFPCRRLSFHCVRCVSLPHPRPPVTDKRHRCSTLHCTQGERERERERETETETETETERDRERQRQRDRDRDRQTDTDRQTDRQAGRQAGRLADRQRARGPLYLVQLPQTNDTYGAALYITFNVRKRERGGSVITTRDSGPL